MTDILGIDVSFAQTTTPNLDHLQFAIAKSSEGNFRDGMWLHHSAEIRKAGKPLGAYHFGRAEWSAHDQAALFLSLAGDADFLALDWEPSPSAHTLMSEEQARTFIKHVQSTGREIGLYAAEHFPREYPHDAFGADWRWIANFSQAPRIPCEIWQYGGTGIDRDRWMGTEAEFAAFVGQTPAPEPPAPTPGDAMYNVAPSKTLRDLVLKAGTVLYADSGLTVRHSVAATERALGFAGSGKAFHVVVNSGNTNYVHREDVVQIVENEREYA